MCMDITIEIHVNGCPERSAICKLVCHLGYRSNSFEKHQLSKKTLRNRLHAATGHDCAVWHDALLSVARARPGCRTHLSFYRFHKTHSTAFASYHHSKPMFARLDVRDGGNMLFPVLLKLKTPLLRIDLNGEGVALFHCGIGSRETRRAWLLSTSPVAYRTIKRSVRITH